MSRAVRDAVFAALDRRLDRASPDPLAVAVSGGGDSMALLHFAAAWAKDRPLQVLTVDHGLNPDSAAWTAFVEAAAGRLGFCARVLRWEGPKPLAGLPAAARTARHALLAEAARHAGARVLLMGHTADDLAEGAVMRAAGSSVGDPREWRPSPAWPKGRGIFVLRPLLAVSRQALRDGLVALGERWIEDPANNDRRFARTRARVPSPLAGEGGPRRGSDEGVSPRALQLGAHTPAGSHAAPTPHPTAPRPPSPARRDGVLRLARREAVDWLGPALLCAAGGTRAPRGRPLEHLRDRLGAGEDFTATLAGARIEAAGDEVLVGRDAGREGLPSLPVGAGEAVVWDGRFEIEADAAGVIRPLKGLMARLDEAGRRTLQAVPAWARPTLPVLETPDGALRGPARRSLVEDRLLAACGAFAREGDLPRLRRGAGRADGLSVEPAFLMGVAE